MKYSSRKKGFLQIAALIVGATAVFLGAFLGEQAAKQSAPVVGSSLPASVPSVFETYLAAQMGSTDTSMTLANGSLRDSTNLTGYQCFTIDANSPSLEYVCGNASGTAVTNLVRGIDAVSGTTSISSLAMSHRLGADVKISDYPILTILTRMANGTDVYPQPITYDPTVATSALQSNGQNLASVNYVNGVAFGGAGVVNATAGAKGVVQIATPGQAAAGTLLGSTGASLALATSFASSTPSTTQSIVVVAKSTGTIDNGFISTSTLLSTSTLSNTYIGTIGKHIVMFTSSGTFTVPTGLSYAFVQVCGAGGDGGSSNAGGTGGGGGSAGGYSQRMVSLLSTTSVAVTITAHNTIGTTSFGNFLFASNGSTTPAGASGLSANPGVGSGGDINSLGEVGFFPSAPGTTGGMGGASFFGGGGLPGTNTNNAVNALTPCSGGGGGGANASTQGGQGGTGLVYITF